MDDKDRKDLVKRCLESEIPPFAKIHTYKNGTIFYCAISDGYCNIGESRVVSCPELKDSFVDVPRFTGGYRRRNPCLRAQELQETYRRK